MVSSPGHLGFVCPVNSKSNRGHTSGSNKPCKNGNHTRYICYNIYIYNFIRVLYILAKNVFHGFWKSTVFSDLTFGTPIVPICSMVLEYLPTFALKITQM